MKTFLFHAALTLFVSVALLLAISAVVNRGEIGGRLMDDSHTRNQATITEVCTAHNFCFVDKFATDD